MPIGPSGRVVIEVDPAFKAELYVALEREGMTLKELFLRMAREFVKNQPQPSLFESTSADRDQETQDAAV